MATSGTCSDDVPTMVDQIPSSSTINATTSIETIQNVLYNNWIYKTTLNIDPSMKTGHVFGLLKIHPNEAHEYIAYFAKAFTVWTGSMKVRVRFMANATNGGSFRVGFLPPQFTREQIRSKISIATLTSYPNMDLDPKNTTWTLFHPQDEKNVLFHYMSTPPEDPASFGGWIVFYVVGPLVTTLQAQGTVSMIVETAGDFQFRQPAPLELSPTLVDFGPIRQAIGLTGTVLSDSPIPVTGVQVCSSHMKTLKAGFTCAVALNGKPLPFTNFVSGEKEGERKVAQSYFEGESSISPLRRPEVISEDPLVVGTRGPTFLPNNTVRPTLRHTCNRAGCSEEIVKLKQLPRLARSFSFEHDRDARVYLNEPLEFSAFEDVIPLEEGFESGLSLSIGESQESIVLFTNSQLASFAVQTASMASELKNRENACDADVSYLYHLRCRGDEIVYLQLRLNPNGVFTTNSTSISGFIPLRPDKYFYLEYQRVLSLKGALPENKEISRRMFTQRIMADKYSISLAKSFDLI